MEYLKAFDDRCIHTCWAGKHIIEVHTRDDAVQCDYPERLVRREVRCCECDWNDTGTDHIRGTIK